MRLLKLFLLMCLYVCSLNNVLSVCLKSFTCSSRVSSFVLCSETIILFCGEILKEDLAYLVIPCRCDAKL